jgi:CMP-2-keto-3-deoxyoctulosonic acid synthetase
LERGHKIKAAKVDSQGISVDTELDLIEVKYLMEKDPYYKAIMDIA